MKFWWFGILVLPLLAGGCTSRAKARAEAQAAYVAGQQQAMMQMREARRTSIRVLGPVQNPEIPWCDGLTLAEVIVAARWLERRDPGQIIVIRQRERFSVEPHALLQGEDIPLEPGDSVELRP